MQIFTIDITFIHSLAPFKDKNGNLQRHLPGNEAVQYSPDAVLLDEPFWTTRHLPKLLLWYSYHAYICILALDFRHTILIHNFHTLQGFVSAEHNLVRHLYWH